MYYNSVIIDTDFETAQQRVTDALQKEGFGVLTEIDVKATLKKKLDVDFRKYKILGACNPPFAYKALSLEESVGVLMPCNVTLQEKENGQILVSAINPMEAMQVVGNEELGVIATEITDKLIKVLESIK